MSEIPTYTSELADQIAKQVQALGAPIGVRCAVIVGGMDMMAQSLALAKRPHIVVATPGRLMDHLENTKGFTLKALKYLVLDEADRLLDLDFGPIIDKLLKVIPKERNTFLFSATLSTKVEKLQRASLSKPIQVKVASKYSTVSTLMQYYVFFPEIQKDAYLFYLVNELSSSSMIIFTGTVDRAQRLSIMLNRLGFPAIPLHGQMSQSARLGSLNKFKSGGRKILVATDVASRGLDIPSVDLVVVSSQNCNIKLTSELRHPHQLERLCPPRRPYRPCRPFRKVDHPHDAVRRRHAQGHRGGHWAPAPRL